MLQKLKKQVAYVDSIVISWRELLIVVLIVLGVYVAEMLLLLRRNGKPSLSVFRRRREHMDEMTLLRADIVELKQRLELLEAQQNGGRSGGVGTRYEEAVAMAQRGLSADDVSAQCGLSRAEADLIVALYQAHRV